MDSSGRTNNTFRERAGVISFFIDRLPATGVLAEAGARRFESED